VLVVVVWVGGRGSVIFRFRCGCLLDFLVCVFVYFCEITDCQFGFGGLGVGGLFWLGRWWCLWVAGLPSACCLLFGLRKLVCVFFCSFQQRLVMVEDLD